MNFVSSLTISKTSSILCKSSSIHVQQLTTIWECEKEEYRHNAKRGVHYRHDEKVVVRFNVLKYAVFLCPAVCSSCLRCHHRLERLERWDSPSKRVHNRLSFWTSIVSPFTTRGEHGFHGMNHSSSRTSRTFLANISKLKGFCMK